jgi:putative endonuclease
MFCYRLLLFVIGGGSMQYVYLLQSITYPEQHYTGLTVDVEKRLATHDAGKSTHTAKYKPWKLVMFMAFTDRCKGIEFEKFLKSGSGRAFAERRLWT